jgi:hypothetical protein
VSATSFLKRWTLRFLLALLVLGAILYFARNLLVRKGLEAAVTEGTGFPLAIDSFDLGLFDSKVDARGLRLSNPAGFEDPRCLEVKRLAADVALRSAFKERLRIEAIDLDIEEVVVVRNAAGEMNLDRLRALGGEGGEKKGKEGKGAKGDGKKKDAPKAKWICERLHLRIARVTYLDYSNMKKGKPKREEFDLKVDETFKNVKGPEEVVKIVVLKVLKNTSIQLLRASVDSLTEGMGDLLKDTGKGLGGALEGIFGRDPKKEPGKRK